MSDLSPLSGVKRKSDFGAVRSAFDPRETSQVTSTDMPIQSPHVRLLGGAQYGLLGGGDARYRRCLHVGEQYFASARLDWKIVSQALHVTHGLRFRRFFRLGIPFRAASQQLR